MARETNDLHKEAMSKGHRMAGAEKWSEAAHAYRAAVDASPNDVNARICLALALYRNGEMNQALQEYDAALKLSPKDALLVARMADIQHRLGRFDLATELLLRAAEIHLQQKQREKALETWRRVADTYADNKVCLELLRKAYAKAGEKQLESETELAIAYICAEVADQKLAVQACRRAIELDPSNERARQTLKSLENGTTDWKSFRLLDQTKVSLDVRKGISIQEGRISGLSKSPDVPEPTSDLTFKPESLREAETENKQNPAKSRTAQWVVKESRRYEQQGDIASAIAVLCKAIDDYRTDDGKDVATIRDRINALLASREQLRIDELVSMPFEDRRIALGGMISIDEYVARGLRLAAVDECLAVIHQIPGYLPAQMRLASIYVDEGNMDIARDKYSYIAKLYHMRGDEGRAAEAMTCLVDISGEDDVLRERLVSFLMEQGSLDSALKQMMRIADARVEKNDLESAMSQLSRMVQLAPDRADVNIKFAEIATMADNIVDAKAGYARALEIEPDNEEAVLGLTLLSALFEESFASQLHLQRFVELVSAEPSFAEKVLNRLAVHKSECQEKREVKLCMGMALCTLGKNDEAISALRAVASGADTVDVVGRYFLALSMIDKGAFDEALDHLSAGLNLIEEQSGGKPNGGEPERGDGANWLELGYLRLMKSVSERLENRSAILTLLNRMKKLAPEDEDIYLELAELYFGAEQPDAAIQEIDQLSRLLVSKNDKARALAIYQNVAERAQGNVTFRKRLYEGYRAVGLLNEATEQLELVVKAELSKGMNAEAREDLGRLIEIYRSSDPKKALATRERLVKLEPKNMASRQELIASYLKMGNPGKALSEAASLASDLIARERQEDAIRVMQQMLKLDPWNVWALEHLGDLLSKLDRQNDCKRVYQKLLQIDADHAAAKNFLAALKE